MQQTAPPKTPCNIVCTGSCPDLEFIAVRRCCSCATSRTPPEETCTENCALIHLQREKPQYDLRREVSTGNLNPASCEFTSLIVRGSCINFMDLLLHAHAHRYKITRWQKYCTGKCVFSNSAVQNCAVYPLFILPLHGNTESYAAPRLVATCTETLPCILGSLHLCNNNQKTLLLC